LVPLKIVSNVSRFKLVLHLNRVLADLNRSLNSLNSISGKKLPILTLDWTKFEKMPKRGQTRDLLKQILNLKCNVLM